MIVIDTTALLTWEVSIERAASEIPFYHCNYAMGSGANWYHLGTKHVKN